MNAAASSNPIAASTAPTITVFQCLYCCGAPVLEFSGSLNLQQLHDFFPSKFNVPQCTHV